MSTSNRTVDCTGIRGRVHIHGLDDDLHHRQEAPWYIDEGYRVTDDHGFDLTLETCADGSRRLVRGEDPFGTYNDRQRLATLARARTTDASGRPIGLPARELTDYEAGQWTVLQPRQRCTDGASGRDHDPALCTTVNCDHPVHFGSDRKGKLTFAKIDEPKKKEDGGGQGGNGATTG